MFSGKGDGIGRGTAGITAPGKGIVKDGISAVEVDSDTWGIAAEGIGTEIEELTELTDFTSSSLGGFEFDFNSLISFCCKSICFCNCSISLSLEDKHAKEKKIRTDNKIPFIRYKFVILPSHILRLNNF